MGAGLPDGLVAGGAQRDPDQHLRNLRDIDLGGVPRVVDTALVSVRQRGLR